MMGVFVMPWFITLAWLHRREYVNQARMVATRFDDILYSFLLTEILLADKVYLQTVFFCNLLSIITQSIAQGFCKPRIIKYPDVITA